MKLFALSLLTMFGLMLAAPAYAAPVAPPECAAMTFDTTIVATHASTVVPVGSGVVLVVGLPHGSNTIVASNATAACIVGGDGSNTIFGSSGDDVIIARGLRSNTAVGGLGNDTCYGPSVMACETNLP